MDKSKIRSGFISPTVMDIDFALFSVEKRFDDHVPAHVVIGPDRPYTKEEVEKMLAAYAALFNPNSGKR